MKYDWHARFLILSCVLILVLQNVQPKPSVKFGFFNCISMDEKYVVIRKCVIKILSRTTAAVQAQITFKTTIKNNLTFDLQFLKKLNGWRPFLYHFKYDACEFFRNPYKNLIVKIAFDEIKNSTNLGDGCPYKNGEDIYMDYKLPNEERIVYLLKRFPIDTGDYALVLKMYECQKLFLVINASIIYSDYSKMY